VTVAALFVDPLGIYPKLIPAKPCDDRCWDESRDARLYPGPWPVVAHPPCNLWVNMAAVNYARALAECKVCGNDREYVDSCARCNGTGLREPNRRTQKPAWYPGGAAGEGGCFAAALAAVRRYGGVLEHPAGSHAWEAHGLAKPDNEGWSRHGVHYAQGRGGYWVCEVWQSAYGHGARKRTWLLYCGARPPFELDWRREPGTHQCGWFDRNKPTLSKREASATPPAFARELIRLAEWSRGT
jgi:hypothetical protein